jgi:hypothetical protein
VVRIINEGNSRWLQRLPGPDEAPAFGTETAESQIERREDAKQ